MSKKVKVGSFPVRSSTIWSYLPESQGRAHKPPLCPGRMITTGCSSYIENLSALTAYELKKATLSLDYRIINTAHFLKKIDSLN